MKILLFPILCLLLCGCIENRSCNSNDDSISRQIIRREDFRPGDRPDEEEYAHVVELGDGINIPAKVCVTRRGYGTLEIANLHLRVVDECDEGLLYENGLLHIEFAYLNTGGDNRLRNLIICGVLVHTDDKTGAALSREPIMSIYSYHPKTKAFSLEYKVGPNLSI